MQFDDLSGNGDLTATQRLELALLANLPNEEIDTTDIPEVRDWTDAKRGLFYWLPKKQITGP
jgi:hypothetical protein